MGKKKSNPFVSLLFGLSETVGEAVMMASTASRLDRTLDTEWSYSEVLGPVRVKVDWDKEWSMSLPEGADDRARDRAFAKAEKEWYDLTWSYASQSLNIRVQVKDSNGKVIFERTRRASR